MNIALADIRMRVCTACYQATVRAVFQRKNKRIPFAFLFKHFCQES